MKLNREQRWTLLICAVLGFGTLVLYWPVRTHPFIHFDDPQYVTENPAIQHGLTWSCVEWAFTSFHANNWHPLTWISHALDVQLFGLDPGAHHLGSVFLHVAAVLALFFALRCLTGRLWPCAVVAAFVAWHPFQVESVAWVAERKNTLSTLFWWLTIWAYAAYAQRPAVLRYVTTLVLFSLGLMAKPMLVTLPLVFLLLDHWPLGRWFGEAGKRPVGPEAGAASGWQAFRGRLPSWSVARRLVGEKIPFFALSAGASVLTVLAQQSVAMVSVESMPLSMRLINAALGYAAYVEKLFWPVHFAIFYPLRERVWIAQLVVVVLLLLVVSVLAVWCARRRGYLFTGWFWYLGTLVPVIGLVQVGSQSMADRYAYVPLAGILIMLAWGGAEWVADSSRRRAVAAASALAALAVCLFLTRAQLSYWERDSKLFQHAIQVTRNNYNAQDNLAIALAYEGHYVEAMEHYQEALRLNPEHAPAYNDLGVTLMRLGRKSEALTNYVAALRLKPDYGMARYNYACALLAVGDRPQAETQYLRAVKLMPGSAEARFGLGTVLEEQGKLAEAAACYQELIRRSPLHASAHHRLGVVLAKQGRVTEGIASMERALEVDPKLADAHNDLGFVLAREGRNEAAVAEYEAAVRLKPDLAAARLNLSRLLVQTGKLEEARREALELLRRQPDLAEARRILAGVLAAQGRWQEVVQPLTELLARNPDDFVSHYQLANAWLSQGKTAKAIEQLREAVRLKPEWPLPVLKLAWLRATSSDARLRDGREAVQLAERACELTGRKEVAALDALAAAYAEAGRFAEAVTAARQALALAQQAGEDEFVARIQQRLGFYQAGRPWRDSF